MCYSVIIIGPYKVYDVQTAFRVTLSTCPAHQVEILQKQTLFKLHIILTTKNQLWYKLHLNESFKHFEIHITLQHFLPTIFTKPYFSSRDMNVMVWYFSRIMSPSFSLYKRAHNIFANFRFVHCWQMSVYDQILTFISTIWLLWCGKYNCMSTLSPRVWLGLFWLGFLANCPS